ncbi:MAG: T9SS type A sorting domain-containing protein, partial [Flavobacteriales bacterium]|nr:T9SS type A sorting domain-containing protein [Flavobacteriales bacterium]
TVTVSGDQGTVTYEWSNTETTASITGLVAGTYTVVVTDDATADCYVIDTVIVGEPQSIGELNNSIEMALYPNPNSGNFVVSISEAGNYNVVIRNVIGQTIKSDLINGTTAEFRLNNVESGIYFVTIQSDGFERTEKIVIK